MKNFWHSQYNSLIKLSQEEILDISQEINREFPLNASSTKPELVILPVDPNHIYVYWNLGINLNAYWNVGKNSRSSSPEDDLDNHLTLRIYSQPSHGTDPDKTKFWFDVPIYGSQTQLQVRLPGYETAYSAAIGKRYPDNRFVVFANSGIINVPLGKSAPYPPEKHIKEPVSIVQTDQPDKQTSTHETPQKRPGTVPITSVNMEISLHDNGICGSTNPESEKGFEVSLTPENNFSGPSLANIPEVKYYNDDLISSIIKNNYSNNDLAEQPTSKRKILEKLDFWRKNTSGQGFKQ